MVLESASLAQVYSLFSVLSYFQIRKLCKKNKNLRILCKRSDFKTVLDLKLQKRVVTLLNLVRTSHFRPNLHFRQIQLRSTKTYRRFNLCFCDAHFWIEEYCSRSHKNKVLYSSSYKDRQPIRQLTYLVSKCYVI